MFFKKKETETITITEVDDEVDSGGTRTATSTTSTPSSNVEGGEGEGGSMDEDNKPLIKKRRVPWHDILLYNKWARVCYLILLFTILGLILPYLLASFAFLETVDDARGTCGLNISYRFDCMPTRLTVPSEETCHDMGCCYDHNTLDLYAPTCFHSIPSEYGYLAYNITTTFGTYRTTAIPKGQRGGLRRVYRLSEAGEISFDLTPLMDHTNLGTEAWSLHARIQLGGDGDVVRVVIYSPEHDDFVDDFPAQSTSPHQLDVTVTQDPGGDFNVTVTRNETGEAILETVFGPMIYGRGFAELTTRLPTSHLYGLGLRRNYDLFPNWGERSRWPLFTEETSTMSGNVSVAKGNSGAHPFFMNFEKTPGYMYGLYLKTSAPVEVGVTPVPAVVFRGVGDYWDLRIMAGPTPKDISRQYTEMVGRPAMPPYWALGYHLCRSAHETDPLSTYDKVVEGMKEAQIPYESDCIDARLNYPNSFTPLPEEVQQRVTAMRGEGRKFTLVQFPFVTYGSDAYSGSSQFLLKHNDSSDYFGTIEGVAVGYPDYADENTLPLWLTVSAEVKGLYGMADGVMLFHNTPLNQASINYTSWNGTVSSCLPNATESCCPDPALPFLPLGVEDINNHSLCVSLLHPSLRNATHLLLHNAYGYYHHKRIRSLMQEIKPESRPFVTSQSTHTGSGAEGGAFGESFGANFIEQKVALVQVLEMGLYGVPLAGLPICGSRNDTVGDVRSEWCLRGHQMAAFWPLMVNHYEYGHQARNPTDFDKAFSRQLAVFIRMRYLLLPYFYTLLYEASQQGTPVVRPLFYEFPQDPASRGVSDQFLVGSALLVSPVLQSVGEQDSIDADVHFPPGRWYNFFSGAPVADSVNGTDSLIPTLLADVNVHVRGGAVVPLQGNLHEWVKTTEDSRVVPFTILVALCCNSTSFNLSSSSSSSSSNSSSNSSSSSSDVVDGLYAEGSLYLDDGVTPHDLTPDPTAEHLQMTSTDRQLTVTRATPAGGEGGGLCSPSLPYSTEVNFVKVFGVDYLVGQVTVKGVSVTTFTQDRDTGALTITDIGYDFCLDPTLLVTWDP